MDYAMKGYFLVFDKELWEAMWGAAERQLTALGRKYHGGELRWLSQGQVECFAATKPEIDEFSKLSCHFIEIDTLWKYFSFEREEHIKMQFVSVTRVLVD